MIEGHGDDAYRYDGIQSDFSTNICCHDSHHQLMAHLAARPVLLDHYPEPEAWSLERMIAERSGISPKSVIVTSGATDAIYLVAHTFRWKHSIIGPTFSEYEEACRQFPSEMEENTVLWLCNPNNPNGLALSRQQVSRWTENSDLTVIDQSYEHYTHQPLMTDKAAIRHGNVVLIHSMTKTYGVPGLRLGYIVASARLTQAMRRFMRPWSVSSLAVEAGKYLLQHNALVCHPDLEEAQRLRTRLDELKGVSVEPTQTNFMLCRLERGSAAALKDYLARMHRMLIRDASNFYGLTPRHFRVAAQRPEENDALVEAVRQFLKQKNG